MKYKTDICVCFIYIYVYMFYICIKILKYKKYNFYKNKKLKQLKDLMLKRHVTSPMQGHSRLMVVGFPFNISGLQLLKETPALCVEKPAQQFDRPALYLCGFSL